MTNGAALTLESNRADNAPMRCALALVLIACGSAPVTPDAGSSAAGGATAGGAAAGGSTAGGSTAGGATSGGSTAGGATTSFTRLAENTDAGPLCNIPPGWVPDSGVAATYIDCALAAGRFSTTNPETQPQQLRVVAWNIEFSKNHAAVLDELKTRPELKDADILLLSEVARASLTSNPQNLDAAADIARQLGMDYAFAVEWDRREKPTELGEHGVAVLSKWPMGNPTQLRHVPLNDWWKQDQLYGGRISLGVDVYVAGRLLRVYATHLCTRGIGDTGRARQAAELRADADLPGRPAWQVVGGDMNTYTCNPSLSNCTVPPAAEQTVEDFLAAGWSDGTAGWNGISQIGAGFFPQRLDWLFYRGGAGTPGQGVMTTGSDHRAIYTTLGW